MAILMKYFGNCALLANDHISDIHPHQETIAGARINLAVHDQSPDTLFQSIYVDGAIKNGEGVVGGIMYVTT